MPFFTIFPALSTNSYLYLLEYSYDPSFGGWRVLHCVILCTCVQLEIVKWHGKYIRMAMSTLIAY